MLRKKVSTLFFELEGWWQRQFRQPPTAFGYAAGRDQRHERADSESLLSEIATGQDQRHERATGSVQPV